MSKGTVNKVILIGRLGADPEIRTTPGGATVGNFNIATDRSYKDRNDTWQEETSWHRIVVWNRHAELARDYLRKGSKVYIEGRLQTRSWDDQNGQKHYMTEVVCENMQFMDSRPDSSAGASYPASQNPPKFQEPDNVDPQDQDVPF